MNQMDSLLDVGVLLLLPLIPAAIIFWLLSTRQKRLRGRVQNDVTKGVITIPVINFQMSFESFGSSATYLVLLAFSATMYIHMENENNEARLRFYKQEVERLTNHYGWRVSIPIVVVNPDGTRRRPWDPIYKQVTATLEPSQNFANSNITFRIAKNEEGFPGVALAIAGSPVAEINLNDPKLAKTDPKEGTIEVPEQVIHLLPASAKP